MASKKKPGFSICSIFGQIEEVAAERMIEQNKATKIPFAEIPECERYEPGTRTPAKFALAIPGPFREEYEELVANLYA